MNVTKQKQFSPVFPISVSTTHEVTQAKTLRVVLDCLLSFTFQPNHHDVLSVLPPKYILIIFLLLHSHGSPPGLSPHPPLSSDKAS